MPESPPDWRHTSQLNVDGSTEDPHRPGLPSFLVPGWQKLLNGVLAVAFIVDLEEVDVALIHDPDDHYAEAMSGSFRALRRLREEGSVRRIGVGMNSCELLCRFAQESDPDCFLVAGRLTPLDRSATEHLVPLCLERGIGLIVGGVFNSGILAGGSTYDSAQAEAEMAQRAARLEEIARRRGVPLTAAAVQFPTRYQGVETVLVGCASASEVEDAVGLAGAAIPSRLWRELE